MRAGGLCVLAKRNVNYGLIFFLKQSYAIEHSVFFHHLTHLKTLIIF